MKKNKIIILAIAISLIIIAFLVFMFFFFDGKKENELRCNERNYHGVKKYDIYQFDEIDLLVGLEEETDFRFSETNVDILGFGSTIEESVEGYKEYCEKDEKCEVILVEKNRLVVRTREKLSEFDPNSNSLTKGATKEDVLRVAKDCH